MTTAPTIRRVHALDVVNLYRLVRKQGEYDRLHPSDEVSALSQVLDAVRNGFGLVAINKAGRLVATIGFAGIRSPSGILRIELIWSACTPPYRGTTVTADFLDLAARAANTAGLSVVVPISLPPESPLIEAVKLAGFKAGTVYWSNKNKNAGQRERLPRVDGRSLQPGRRKQVVG